VQRSNACSSDAKPCLLEAGFPERYQINDLPERCRANVQAMQAMQRQQQQQQQQRRRGSSNGSSSSSSSNDVPPAWGPRA
jgi:transcription initiation factor TFIID subunit TAF12